MILLLALPAVVITLAVLGGVLHIAVLTALGAGVLLGFTTNNYWHSTHRPVIQGEE